MNWSTSAHWLICTQVVDLMSKNVANCSEGKKQAQANMQQLIDFLKEFHAAVRAFGQKGWCRRGVGLEMARS